GGITGGEIGDAAGEPHTRAHRGGLRQRDPDVHGVAGRVGDADQVPSLLFTEADHASHQRRLVRPEEEAEAGRRHTSSRSWPTVTGPWKCLAAAAWSSAGSEPGKSWLSTNRWGRAPSATRPMSSGCVW